MGKKRVIVGLVAGLVIISGLVFAILFVTRNAGKTGRTISAETAQSRLADMVREVDPSYADPIKSAVEYSETDLVAEELPELDNNPVTAKATTDTYAEIWSSPEKANSGTDGWIREMAEQFNASGATVQGKPVSVQIRTMSSGLGVDYIATGKAAPAGYTPATHLPTCSSSICSQDAACAVTSSASAWWETSRAFSSTRSTTTRSSTSTAPSTSRP